MEFYGFADEHGARIQDEIITTPSAYMLFKLNHDVGINVALPGLPASVIGIEPERLSYRVGEKYIAFTQFPVTLAYADYKCQGQTYVYLGHRGHQETESPFSLILSICSTISRQTSGVPPRVCQSFVPLTPPNYDHPFAKNW